METTTTTEKKTRARKSSKEDLVQKKIAAKIDALTVEALEEIEQDEDVLSAHKEDWANRYRCKVNEVSRKGSKNVELYVGHPTDPNRPYRLNIKLGQWIEEGLPMSVIRRLQESFDTDAEDKEAHELTGSAGNNHRMLRAPRFAVQMGKLVEAK